MPTLPAGVEVPSGRFVNGKATFFKFILTGALKNNDVTLTAHGITGSYVVIGAAVTATNGDDHVTIPFVQAQHLGSGNFMIQVAIIGANLRIETEADWTDYTQSQAILEYYYL